MQESHRDIKTPSTSNGNAKKPEATSSQLNLDEIEDQLKSCNFQTASQIEISLNEFKEKRNISDRKKLKKVEILIRFQHIRRALPDSASILKRLKNTQADQSTPIEQFGAVFDAIMYELRSLSHIREEIQTISQKQRDLNQRVEDDDNHIASWISHIQQRINEDEINIISFINIIIKKSHFEINQKNLKNIFELSSYLRAAKEQEQSRDTRFPQLSEEVFGNIINFICDRLKTANFNLELKDLEEIRNGLIVLLDFQKIFKENRKEELNTILNRVNQQIDTLEGLTPIGKKFEMLEALLQGHPNYPSEEDLKIISDWIKTKLSKIAEKPSAIKRGMIFNLSLSLLGNNHPKIDLPIDNDIKIACLEWLDQELNTKEEKNKLENSDFLTIQVIIENQKKLIKGKNVENTSHTFGENQHNLRLLYQAFIQYSFLNEILSSKKSLYLGASIEWLESKTKQKYNEYIEHKAWLNLNSNRIQGASEQQPSPAPSSSQPGPDNLNNEGRASQRPTSNTNQIEIPVPEKKTFWQTIQQKIQEIRQNLKTYPRSWLAIGILALVALIAILCVFPPVGLLGLVGVTVTAGIKMAITWGVVGLIELALGIYYKNIEGLNWKKTLRAVLGRLPFIIFSAFLLGLPLGLTAFSGLFSHFTHIAAGILFKALVGLVMAIIPPSIFAYCRIKGYSLGTCIAAFLMTAGVILILAMTNLADLSTVIPNVPVVAKSFYSMTVEITLNMILAAGALVTAVVVLVRSQIKESAKGLLSRLTGLFSKKEATSAMNDIFPHNNSYNSSLNSFRANNELLENMRNLISSSDDLGGLRTEAAKILKEYDGQGQLQMMQSLPTKALSEEECMSQLEQFDQATLIDKFIILCSVGPTVFASLTPVSESSSLQKQYEEKRQLFLKQLDDQLETSSLLSASDDGSDSKRSSAFSSSSGYNPRFTSNLGEKQDNAPANLNVNSSYSPTQS